MAKLDAFFKLMVDQGASDLHLVSGSQPILRVHGELQRIRFAVLENDELKKMLYEVAPENKIKIFEETGDADFAYEIPGLARYRANYFVQKYGVAGSLSPNSRYHSERRAAWPPTGLGETPDVSQRPGPGDRPDRQWQVNDLGSVG